ncbi:MAG: hypothetical protein Q8O55_02855 [Dehalococcoidales bacterium]|nr:hypothetical protein [Dehalococcoidales bacterium]
MLENLPVILIAIGLILLLSLFRRGRSAETRPLEIAQRLLSEVRLNLRITELFIQTQRASKLMASGWRIDKDKLDFLSQPLQATLSDAFTVVEDFNQQVAAAKKYKTTSYLAAVDADKLREKLIKSQEGLEEWFNSQGVSTEASLKMPGIFDGWLGKG